MFESSPGCTLNSPLNFFFFFTFFHSFLSSQSPVQFSLCRTQNFAAEEKEATLRSNSSVVFFPLKQSLLLLLGVALYVGRTPVRSRPGENLGEHEWTHTSSVHVQDTVPHRTLTAGIQEE